jgi:hypothetical protein
VALEGSPWVLILGAVVGGLLCYSFQTVRRTLTPPAGATRVWGWYVSEVLSAVLLPAIATVLLSRLGSTDFPISVKVRDVWGAIAVGFIIQWLGHEWFTGWLPSRRGRIREATAPAQGQDGQAAPLAPAPAPTPSPPAA